VWYCLLAIGYGVSGKAARHLHEGAADFACAQTFGDTNCCINLRHCSTYRLLWPCPRHDTLYV